MSQVILLSSLRAIAENSYEHTVAFVCQETARVGPEAFFGEDVGFQVLATYADRVRLLAASGRCVEVPFRLTEGRAVFGVPSDVALPVFESASEGQRIVAESLSAAIRAGSPLPASLVNQALALME